MNEALRKKIIAGIMICVIIWAGFNLDNGPKTLPSIDIPKTIQPLSPDSLRASHILSKQVIEDREKASWGRDPFISKDLGVESKVQIPVKRNLVWNLSGIIYGNDPIAIINKKPVKVGQRINNAEIVKIDKNRVTIKYNDKQILLTVSKG